MVKGYLVFENEQIWAEAILQVVLEIFEKNNVMQPSQSSDAYTLRCENALIKSFEMSPQMT